MKKYKTILKILIPIVMVLVMIGICILAILTTHDIKYIAHRGHGYYENTEEAFYNSKDFWGIECDVRITSDNKFVLNHNSIAVFDDGVELDISKSTYDALTSRTLGGGYRLCSLERYLDICEEMSKVAIIELKSSLNDDEVTMLLDEIENYYDIDKCVIISFSSDNLLKVKAQSDIELHYLINGGKVEAIDFCIENGINPSIQYYSVEKSDVIKVHNYGLKIGVWTMNSSFSNFRMKHFGVDYVTSDVYSK